jgi:hypothetical protein
MSLESKIDLTFDISLNELAGQIVLNGLNHEDIIRLIKKLDENINSWDATEKLYNHFAKLHEEYLKENKT